jgi:Ca2+/H+ antiporter, TMEM165/GDT1 family
MHGWALFFSVFGVIFVAELPDKTALAALVLATRHRALPVLIGAATALTIQSLVAVAAGHLVSLLPQRPVHLFAGGLFVVSAVIMWLRKEGSGDSVKDRGNERGFWRTTWFVFIVVFIAEWGDLTQLATAALAAHYHAPYVVSGGATLALWAVAALAIFVGRRAGKLLDAHLTKRIAAVLFADQGLRSAPRGLQSRGERMAPRGRSAAPGIRRASALDESSPALRDHGGELLLHRRCPDRAARRRVPVRDKSQSEAVAHVRLWRGRRHVPVDARLQPVRGNVGGPSASLETRAAGGRAPA